METWFVYVKIENKKKKGKINRNYKSQKIITIYRMRRRSKRLIGKQKKKKKLLHESDRFKEEEEKRRAR